MKNIKSILFKLEILLLPFLKGHRIVEKGSLDNTVVLEYKILPFSKKMIITANYSMWEV